MTSSRRTDSNSSPPQDEEKKGASSVSGQHRFDLNKTLGSDDAAKAIAEGRKAFDTLAGTPPSSFAAAQKKLRAMEEQKQVGTKMGEAEEEKPRESQANLEEAEADAKKGMDTFTHYADTITDSLFLIIGKFTSAVNRINFAIVLLLLVAVGVAVLIYRFEGGLDVQAEERKKNEELRTELKTLKRELVEVKHNAKDTKDAVQAVKEAAEDKPDIDIVTDERTGREKLVIVRKESRVVPDDVPLVPEPEPAPKVAAKPVPAAQMPPPPPPVAKPAPAPRPTPKKAAPKKGSRKRVEIPLPPGMVEQFAK